MALGMLGFKKIRSRVMIGIGMLSHTALLLLEEISARMT
jgi:hypothetical protein